METNKAKLAKEAFRAAIDEQDDNRIAAEYCRTLARLHIALGEYHDAADVLHEGATLVHDYYETRFQYAVVLAILGDLDGAASEVQGAMLTDAIYEARAGLVPELTTIYRDRLKRLHHPIAAGAEPPTYDARLHYGTAAIELDENELARAYLVRHLSAYDVSDHVRHFDRLLQLPSHPASSELLRGVFEDRSVANHLKLPTLLGIARKLLDTYGVNAASSIAGHSLDSLLMAWRTLLALPEVILAPVIERIADDRAFGNVRLARALDWIADVHRLGPSYAEAVATMLSWHAPTLSKSAITTWVVLDRLAATGCIEQLRTSVALLLHATRWLEELSYWNRRTYVASVSGLPEDGLEHALKPHAIERRVNAVYDVAPTLAARIVGRLMGQLGPTKVFAAIPHTSKVWASTAFRRALFRSVSVDAGIDHFLRTLSLLPREVIGGAAADLAELAH